MRYHNPSLEFECADLAENGAYKRIASALESRGFKKHSLDFINLGVVIDVGQCNRDDDPYVTAKKSVEVCRNQFLLMLDFLKPGGSCMWIHSGSHLDTYLFYLNWLNRMFERLRVTNTLVPSRSPVYTIAENFIPGDSDAALKACDDFREFLLSHPADPSTPEIWQRLLAPSVFPLEFKAILLGCEVGEEAVEGCLVKGKINGKDSTMYMRVNEEGDTIIHHYDGDTSHLNKIRMLPGKFFPVTYDDGCEAYVDGIHSVWYTRDNKYRAAVDEASAGGAPIADAFVQNMFDKVITA
ncbi:hypothetical protein FOZ63_019516 [Perkinsus olseni]|uniref:Uncharacterized protein n=1 Tax=Perkinsus olseni TaxID=32597 RepID=A0A7J6UJ56_PEROL|nr:hypothetical protein FOZ63_019516 [Perkinsus olseni]